MKNREIERLRAAAILMVITVHWDSASRFLPEIARKAWSGVDLFFVISGYVVTLSLLRTLPPLEAEESFIAAFDRAKAALKSFYVRRFFRIVPAVLVCALIQRFAMLLLPVQFGTPNEWTEEIVAFFGGVYNYTRPFHGEYHFGPYWSLSVEEHFYILLPIVFVLARTTNRRLLACAIIGGVCILARPFAHPVEAVPVLEYQEKFSSQLRFDSLMAGVALALIAGHETTRSVMPRSFMRLGVLPACLALIACLPGAAPTYVMHREGFIALWFFSGILVFFAGLDRGYVLSFPVIGRLLEHVGSRSYALYLLHVPVLWLDEGVRPVWPAYADWVPHEGDAQWQRCIVLFAVSMLLAEALYRGIEQPFIRMGKTLVAPDHVGPVFSIRARRLGAVGLGIFALLFFRHRLMIRLGPPNLALDKPVEASSREPNTPTPSALTNGNLESEGGLQTLQEENPWAIVDLGAEVRIGAIRVYNRADGGQDEALPLELSVSVDGEKWHLVARREAIFTQSFPWRVQITRAPPVRYVRLQVPRTTHLVLSEVEIFGSEAMAAMP